MCQIGGIPGDVSPESMDLNRDSVSDVTSSQTISVDEETVKYEFKISTGDAPEEEKSKLSDAMKTACDGKEIVSIEEVETNKDTFDEMAAGGIVAIGDSTSQHSGDKPRMLK